jgi:hypothetical protein
LEEDQTSLLFVEALPPITQSLEENTAQLWPYRGEKAAADTARLQVPPLLLQTSLTDPEGSSRLKSLPAMTQRAPLKEAAAWK